LEANAESVQLSAVPDDLDVSDDDSDIEDSWELLCLSDDETLVDGDHSACSSSAESSILIITERIETNPDVLMMQPLTTQSEDIPRHRDRVSSRRISSLRPEAISFVPTGQQPVESTTILNPQYDEPAIVCTEEHGAELLFHEEPNYVIGNVQNHFDDQPALPWRSQCLMENSSSYVPTPTGPRNGWFGRLPTLYRSSYHTMSARIDRQSEAISTAVRLLAGDWSIDPNQKWWEPPVPMGFRARAAFRQPGRN
jgi:hypothetical protein